MSSLPRTACSFLHAVDARTNGHEVGEHAAEPALVDVRHIGALGCVLDSLLSLLLGADEQNLTALGADVLEEGIGLVSLDDGLFEIEDVDAVALAEDERTHLGVPATGLVTEVAASLEQGTDINLGSHVLPPGLPPCDVGPPAHPKLCYLESGTADNG